MPECLALTPDSKWRMTVHLKTFPKFVSFLDKLFMIYFGMLGIALLAGFYELFSKIHMPLYLDSSENIFLSDVVTVIVGAVQMIIVIVLFVNYLRWIYKMNKIIASRENGVLEYTPGFSVAYYFIPILCLFRPYQVMRNYWQIVFRNEGRQYSMVKWWWAVWLFSNIIGRIAVKYTLAHLDSDTEYFSTVIYLCSDAVDLLMYILLYKIVNTLTGQLVRNYGE